MEDFDFINDSSGFSNGFNAGIWSLNVKDDNYLFCSPDVEKICGFSSDKFIEQKIIWDDLIYEEDKVNYRESRKELKKGKPYNGYYRITHHSGEIKWIFDHTTPSFDINGQLIRLDGVVIDITVQKEMQERITFLAYHDHLTNLPNQRMFEKELKSVISNQNQINCQNPIVVMYIDVDDFKRINDTFGHLFGDQLLKEISQRLQREMTNNEVLARIGGDEFSVLIKDSEHPITLAEKIIASFHNPIFIGDYEFDITLSIGISIQNIENQNLNLILKNADVALFKAKEAGKGKYQIYNDSMEKELIQTQNLEKDLRKALKNKEFSLYYQPKVCTKTGKIAGAEALIRWHHPELGMISPSEFIPVVEENGAIFEITDWTFQTVCEQIKQWGDMDIPITPISVNISPKRFLKDDWVERFVHIIHETNVNPKLLELEITESALIENQEKFITSIKILKNMGIKISLDDFGTGYSSLLYLKRFMIDTVKIDQYFIKTYLLEGDCPIAKHIISLAHELDMIVVAEGVETEKQRSFLQENGCDQIQGYLFSKPIPVTALTELLTNTTLEYAIK
jgi:diguanylate cyclase (GGDEF)-like protein/PAS domain S-box-containing protein